jgi:hypothetical protein
MEPELLNELAAHEEPPQRMPTRRDRQRAGIIPRVLLGVLLLMLIGVVAWLASGTQEQEERRLAEERIPGPTAVTVEVYNASGISGLAQRCTDELRKRGFDVVDYGTDRSRVLQQTTVIDRSGRGGAAAQVAEALRLPPERVRQKLDKKLLIDVTILLGTDAMTLDAFRTTSWRDLE